MTLSLIPKIGAIAGWKLELASIARGTPNGNPALAKPPVRDPRTTTFSSVDYRGRVDATLVSGLGGGSYTIVVEGVSEDDYKALVGKAKAQDRDLLEARLYLFWLDAPGSAVVGDGLVAVLRVTALRRRAGKWRYEMVVEGREMVYDQLARVGPAVNAHGPLEAAAALARAMFVELSPPPVVPPATDVRSTDGTATALHELGELEKEIVKQAATSGKPRAGLGMYLIHNGTLRMGPDRITAVVPEEIRDAGDGLLVIERSGLVREDERAISLEDTAPKHRDQYTLTLRGRPDLRPGSVITFDPPERSVGVEDLGFALGPAAPSLGDTEKVTAYVQEVTHRLSREQGFVTTVRAVVAGETSATAIDLVDRLWFAGTAPDTAAAAASGESILTRIIDTLRGSNRRERWPDVAQVRAHHLTATAEAPAQTERVWSGLADDDGKAYGAARLKFGSHRRDIHAAPYLTPFAYGKTGLVLPRYPGTRVVVMNRGGEPTDPIDVGALWSRDDAPAKAQLGDWWLSLPVDLDGSAPPPAAFQNDNDTGEQRVAAKTTHDLIDATGNRVIEVGKLTIRIGKDGLRAAGERPPVGDPPVLIEHDSGKARITIAQDGSITIETQKKLTLKGDDGIALQTTKGITMTVGQNVTVKKGT
jgi:hypothetical protein